MANSNNVLSDGSESLEFTRAVAMVKAVSKSGEWILRCGCGFNILSRQHPRQVTYDNESYLPFFTRTDVENVLRQDPTLVNLLADRHCVSCMYSSINHKQHEQCTRSNYGQQFPGGVNQPSIAGRDALRA